jgi:hypothetical protein
MRKPAGLILGCLIVGSASAHAESVIDFRVENGHRRSEQSIMIKNGMLLVKAAGGDEHLDILYERDHQRLVLIDHKKRNFTPLTSEKIDRMARQVEEVQPLIRGVSEQLHRLPSKQRAKWESMLGGISLDQFESAKREAESMTLKKTGSVRKVAGIACEPLSVVKGDTTTADFCIADPTALALPEDDSATLRSLIQFTQHLAERAQGLTAQFGFPLPANGMAALTGIPVEMRDLSGTHPSVITLSGISTSKISADLLAVPAGYQPKDLALW